eukprot:5024297-Prymnesium_polylepis.1
MLQLDLTQCNFRENAPGRGQTLCGGPLEHGARPAGPIAGRAAVENHGTGAEHKVLHGVSGGPSPP